MKHIMAYLVDPYLFIQKPPRIQVILKDEHYLFHGFMFYIAALREINMTAMFNNVGARAAFILAFMGLSINVYASTISIYISPPKVQASSKSDVIVEMFNKFNPGILPATGHLAIGSYENPLGKARIQSGSITGGAGLTKYIMGGPIRIVFDSPSNYLGFWWSTMDTENQIELYDVTGNLIIMLNGKQMDQFFSRNENLVGVDGNLYSPKQYNGNPFVSHRDADRYYRYSLFKKYFYLNLFVDGPDRIHTMIIRGDLFEVDNIATSVRYSEPDESMIPMLNLEY